MISNPETVT